MGNEHSQPRLTSTAAAHHGSATNNNARTANNNNNNDQNQNQHHQHQSASPAEPIDRRVFYRNQDRRFAKLVREERSSYASPPLKFNNTHPKQQQQQAINDRLGPLPKSEIPSGLAGQPKATLWPDPWVALMVRCGAIAPFADGHDNDPLSTSDFVSFMLQTMTAPPPPSTSKEQDQNGQATSSTKNKLKNSNNNHNDDDDDDADGNDYNEWLVIDTAESRIPFVSVAKPWPLEECCICLNMYDTGLNHCGRCHQSICSECLLHLVKPVKIDASNDANIKAAIGKKRRCMLRVEKLILKEEFKMNEELNMLEATSKKLEKEQQRGNNNNNNYGKVETNAKNNKEGIDAIASSISNFAKMGAFAVSGAIEDALASFGNHNQQHNNKTLSHREVLLKQQQETSEFGELQQAKRILELLKRQEVTGLFFRPKEIVAGNNVTSSHNNNQNNVYYNDEEDFDDTNTSDDEDDDNDVTGDDEGRRPPHRSPSSHEDDHNNNDVHHQGVGQQQQLISKLENQLLYGKYHWATPIIFDFDDCSDKEISLLDKIRTIVQKAIRVESRGRCPMCQAFPAIWYFSGRKLRTRMLYELMAQHGADPRIFGLFTEVSTAEEEERKNTHKLLEASLAASPATTTASSSATTDSAMMSRTADQVWIQPTQDETVEYEICIALALSSVMSSTIVDVQQMHGESSSTYCSKIEQLLNESKEWATVCKHCGAKNWKEYRCRICRAVRM